MLSKGKRVQTDYFLKLTCSLLNAIGGWLTNDGEYNL